jgi:hypothetical protein
MPNQVESYKKVIEIMGSEDFTSYDNFRKLLVTIAMNNPQVLVDAYNFVNGKGTHYGVSDAVMGYLLEGRKIMAIKQYRTETGTTLKEAKDKVEDVIYKDSRLWEKFGRREGGLFPPPDFNAYP